MNGSSTGFKQGGGGSLGAGGGTPVFFANANKALTSLSIFSLFRMFIRTYKFHDGYVDLNRGRGSNS